MIKLNKKKIQKINKNERVKSIIHQILLRHRHHHTQEHTYKIHIQNNNNKK